MRDQKTYTPYAGYKTFSPGVPTTDPVEAEPLITRVQWIESADRLPEDGERILFYRPTKLTKIGEMVYMDSERKWFQEENPYWAKQLRKPI